MKYFKYLFLTVFSFFLFSVDVSALPYDEYVEKVDIYDIEYFEFYNGAGEVGYSARPFAILPEQRYQKDSFINVSHMYWEWIHSVYGHVAATGDLVFGSYTSQNSDVIMKLYIYNNGQPLFDVPGQFGLEVCIRGKNNTLSVYRTDGSVSTIDVPDSTLTETVHYFELDNQHADIVKIVLYVGNYTASPSGGDRVYGEFTDYGYIVEQEEPEPEPEEPEVPLVGGDLNGTISYILSFIVSIVDTLFLLQIVEGVTFGYFILACMIFGLVFSFLFRNMVK